MIKYLVFLISTSSIMMLNMLKFEDVDITHSIPDFLAAGQSYDVDIRINKGDIEGFAKFQMEIPDGINVVSTEISNSSFTFSDGVVKNIWMTIPNDSEIILSYKFEVGANHQGTGTIKAQFVYIKDNERYSVGMNDHHVTIGEDGGVAEVVNENDAAFVPEMVKGYRSVKALGGNEYEVKIRVEKDGLEGFAKIQDELPEGFEASLLIGGESIFTVKGDKVKFVWFNVPPANDIEVSYLLKAVSGDINTAVLRGTFNFIYKNDARFIDLPEESLELEETVVEMAEEIQEEPEPTIEPVVVAAIPEPKKEEPVVVEEEIVEEEPEPEPVVAFSGPQGDVFYRVQLAAGKNNVKVTYFKNKYKFRGEIYLENHKGWYKYTTGNYDKYRMARDRREEIKEGYEFRGPFVTAYNAGERITVQEALLITKQKWVK